MRQFGLIGFPLTHSFSPDYFAEKFRKEHLTDCRYDLFEIPSVEAFPDLLLQNSGLAGLNVTIPYKESIMPWLDEISEEARKIGAVNCIRITAGKTLGYNTDVFGFRKSLLDFVKSVPDRVFVLGTGGSSKAVCYVLSQLGWPFVSVSRSSAPGTTPYEAIESLKSGSCLFINTTPLGMFPDVNSAPAIPYHLLTHADHLFDLIYNPAETIFLQQGKSRGASVKNGFEMLQWQAEKSWEIWNN